MNTEFYVGKHLGNNGTKHIYKAEFLGMELVRLTNMSLDSEKYKPIIYSQHNFVTEVLAGDLIKIGASELK